MMIRSLQGIAVFFAVLTVSAQQPGVSQTQKGPPASFSSSVVERSFVGGAGIPSRKVQTRTESNGREVVTEMTEVPDLDGKMRMSLETTSETVRTGADSTQTRHDVFVPDGQGRRRLMETTQVDMQTLGPGSTRSLANTWTPDLNGRMALSGRQIQETKTPSPNVKQTDTTIYRPGMNEPLLESERLQRTERKVSNDLTETESTRIVRDGNGRWQTAEARNEEVRVTGNERVAEETVRRSNVNGTLEVSEKKITRQSKNGGQDETVVETYAQNVLGVPGNGSRLELNQRVRTTTSVTVDGGQQTVREVEGRRSTDPRAPMHVIERIVDTVRQIGPDQWEVQRQVFALDGNGRMVPVQSERGQAVGK